MRKHNGLNEMKDDVNTNGYEWKWGQGMNKPSMVWWFYTTYNIYTYLHEDEWVKMDEPIFGPNIDGTTIAKNYIDNNSTH